MGTRAGGRVASSASKGSLKCSLCLLVVSLLIDVTCTVLLVLSSHDWNSFITEYSGSFHDDVVDLVILLGARFVFLVLAGVATACVVQREPPPVAQVNIQGDDDEKGDMVPLLIDPEDDDGETDPIIRAEKARMPHRERQAKYKTVVFVATFIISLGCGVYTAIKGVSYNRAGGKTATLQAVVFFTLVVTLEAHVFFAKAVLDALTKDEGVLLPMLHMHPLRYSNKVAGHICDICTVRLFDGQAFQCAQCDVDVCLPCVRARKRRTAEGAMRGDKGAREEKAVTIREYCSWSWRLSKGFRKYIVFAICALLANMGARIFLPNFQGKVIDSVIHADHDRFWKMLKWYGGLSAGVMAFGVVRLASVSIVSRKLGWAVRNKAFESILRQDIAFFDGANTGALTSIVGQNTMAMVSPINTLVNTLLSNILLLGGSLIMCLIVSWKLSLLAFIAVGPIIYITGQYAKWSRGMNRQIYDKLAEAQGIAQEAFSNIRTVRSFSTEKRETEKYREQTGAALARGVKDSVASAGTYGMTNFLDLGIMVLILGYGGALAMNGDDGLSLGELITFQLYVNMMNNSYQQLNSVLNSFTRSAGAAQKVLAVFENAPDIDITAGLRPDGPPEGHLRLEDIEFAYQMRPDQKVLTGLTLDIPAHKTTALVGRSGGGKSTLVHLMMRFYDPREGRVVLDGRPLPDYSMEWYHENVGMVSQDTQLFAKSIEYNITYGAPEGTTKADIELAAKRAHAHDFITSFDEGYNTRVGERGVRLSGGQKQRIAIARAFLRKPRILFLDEATSALDAEAEHYVQQAIDELVRSMAGGCTIVMIAHRLSTVMNADQIAVVQNGRVQEVGTHSELLEKDGDYASLVQRQLQNSRGGLA